MMRRMGPPSGWTWLRLKGGASSCDNCGWPLENGDRFLSDGGAGMCSIKCIDETATRETFKAIEDAKRPTFGDIDEPATEARQLDMLEPELFDDYEPDPRCDDGDDLPPARR